MTALWGRQVERGSLYEYLENINIYNVFIFNYYNEYPIFIRLIRYS